MQTGLMCSCKCVPVSTAIWLYGRQHMTCKLDDYPPDWAKKIRVEITAEKITMHIRPISQAGQWDTMNIGLATL